MNKPIRILIADNDPIYAKDLKIFLNAQEGIQVVDIVRDGQGAISAYKESLPDLVIVDLHLPVLDSVKTIQAIIDHNEHANIMCISAIANDRYAIEAVKAGARGYVPKNGNACYQDIAFAVQQIAGGEVVLDSTLALHILQEFS